MKVFITGATGFVGGAVAAKLRERGDDVVALVRDPERAAKLSKAGCELVQGDLSSVEAMESAMMGCDGAIHSAAIYEIGVTKQRCNDLYETNVAGTERVLSAALKAEVAKVVYISTVNAFGDTHGEVVDETHVHHEDYVSCYDETKHLAHKVAQRMIEGRALPGVIALPGGVYGPGDTSEAGAMYDRFLKGKLPAIAFADAGFNMVYIDDVADGILLCLDKGKVGESYVLGGELTTVGGVIKALANAAGRDYPRVTVPSRIVKTIAPLGPVIGPMMGFPRNLREVVRAADGVTYWARHDKAMRELGYSPRSLDEGMKALIEARASQRS
ncbi:MAG TPA: NAD-dependent epimerase/dehydratase family protein [Actinomycetota bacterium]|nr:NAD-dependent epimerase/dehydratase family protein [Actinomycetota bacterium]